MWNTWHGIGLFIYLNCQWMNCISVGLLYQNIWEDLRLFLRSELNFKTYLPHQAQQKSLPWKVSFPIKPLWDKQRKWGITGVTHHFLSLISGNSPVPAFQLNLEDLIQIPWKGLGPPVWMNTLISQVSSLSCLTLSGQWVVDRAPPPEGRLRMLLWPSKHSTV